MTVAPGVAASSGHHAATEQIHVTNHGTAPLDVTGTPVVLTGPVGKCAAQPSGWVRVEPARFTVEPGHTVTVTLTATPPPSAAGNVSVGALFSGASSGPGLHVAGAVGSRLDLSLGGRSATTSCVHAVAAPQVKTGGGPLDLILGVSAALVIVLLAVVGITFSRWRHRRLARHERNEVIY